ncbi:MAG TPA: type II CAAX endopeptidase family protein [Candidatus Eisenbacteria bacterium]|nr:type II CAAX endopeptidase family protein [Candidatus Eisenbacteria bacterium]
MDNLPSPTSVPRLPDQLSAALPPPPDRNIVFFNDRGLRAGWRLLIYIFFVAVAITISGFIMRRTLPHVHGMPSPQLMLLQEAVSFSIVFGCALIMSRIEGRSPGVYGLPISQAFGRNFWLGMLLGLAEISVLMGLVAAFGGYSFGSLALSPSGIIGWGLIHLLLFICVGFFEEFLFRGYTQFTLGDGIGFWPAALLLSLGFGAAHLSNPGEGPVGAASVALVGIFFAFTLYRTGNLWYAVGLHASFDWGESFLYSVPDSGTIVVGHLSNSLLHGPKWLTGASVGPEGSVFCFLTMGLQFLIVFWLFPKRRQDPGAPVALEAPAA